MSDEFRVTFKFASPECREGFLLWFFFCAGDQDYWQTCEVWNQNIAKDPNPDGSPWPVAGFDRPYERGETPKEPDVVIDATLEDEE